LAEVAAARRGGKRSTRTLTQDGHPMGISNATSVRSDESIIALTAGILQAARGDEGGEGERNT